jgi:4-amino-4-deoxy-L-arabinose transferase-like glycosyltransferase
MASTLTGGAQEIMRPEAGPAGKSALSDGQPAGALLDYHFLRRPRWLVLPILIGYVFVALLCARFTPAWQNPDEPAHYNYIAYIAGGNGLPSLHLGDYSQPYISFLVSNNFPLRFPTDPLRYESYQPPLYYLAGALVHLASGGSLFVLRLFSIALSVLTLLLLYHILELVFTAKPLIAAGGLAFAAFLPMHVAVSASVSNDVLAELILMAAITVMVHWMRDQFQGAPGNRSRLLLLLLGCLLGLGLLTKIYAYLMTPLLALTVLLVIWRQPRTEESEPSPHRPGWRTFGQGMLAAGWVVAPALLIALPMWLRNLNVYGWPDLLGLRWHDVVVAGQPTTAEWIARYGILDYLERGLSLTFRSFWGVFGWLGVFMDERIYTLLLIFSGALMLGMLWAVVRFICGRPETDMDRFQFWILGLLAVELLGVLFSYFWYNTKFVQHQGRYLFWGMLPLATFSALGWRELLHPLQAKVTGLLLATLAVALTGVALFSGSGDKLVIVAIGAGALLLLSVPLLQVGVVSADILALPHWLHRLMLTPWIQRLLGPLRFAAWISPFVLLLALNIAIPFWYIQPQLGR